MKRPNWAGDWKKPDLDSLAGVDADKLPFQGYTRRSVVPDGLTVLLAAESGKPILYPIYPINGFTPHNGCDSHRGGPIPKGSAAYCEGCHDTGLRDHPALKLDPADLPEPEPILVGPEDFPGPDGRLLIDDRETPLTRKQRRAQTYGRAPAPTATA